MIVPLGDEVKAKLATDPLFRLEHEAADKQAAQAKKGRLEQLLQMQEDRADTWAMSCEMRSTLRAKKKEAKAEEEYCRSKGIWVPLLPEAPEDVTAAKLAMANAEPEVRAAYETRTAAQSEAAQAVAPPVTDPHLHLSEVGRALLGHAPAPCGL
eukprot:CAMPEP_0177672602 /NCGR_PEP_ID=MMETSP0447-20121125/25439_1 /TAXON_ID=0 /ORGANISM="Stygamoeba regulata, Strain BSH-02190019" /LENGTH=153 /DNA_ID=CAMNT_0019180301 /DNA_START=3 /DNA_END=465 /DNA_ORIENTATION=+